MHVRNACNTDFRLFIVLPSKNALARKGPFLLHPCKILQDPAGSFGILQEFRARILQVCCIISQVVEDLARSCRDARKKDLFLQDLARAFLLDWRQTVNTLYIPSLIFRPCVKVNTFIFYTCKRIIKQAGFIVDF